MLIKHIIRREVVIAALGAAERVANLVLGAQVVDQCMLLPEDLAAHLTDELQALEQRDQSVKFGSELSARRHGVICRQSATTAQAFLCL